MQNILKLGYLLPHRSLSSCSILLCHLLCDFLVTFESSCNLRDGLLDFPKPNTVSSLSDEPKDLSHWGNCAIEYFTKKMEKRSSAERSADWKIFKYAVATIIMHRLPMVKN